MTSAPLTPRFRRPPKNFDSGVTGHFVDAGKVVDLLGSQEIAGQVGYALSRTPLRLKPDGIPSSFVTKVRAERLSSVFTDFFKPRRRHRNAGREVFGRSPKYPAGAAEYPTYNLAGSRKIVDAGKVGGQGYSSSEYPRVQLGPSGRPRTLGPTWNRRLFVHSDNVSRPVDLGG